MERFTLEPNFFIYKSKKYEKIYNTLSSKKIFNNMAEIFTFACVIGYKNKNKVKLAGRGTEMRSEHFKEKELVPLMSIIFEESNFDNDIFYDYDLIKAKFNDLEEYAEGGMEILCSTAFDGHWNGIEIDDEYDEYEIDLARFILDNLNVESYN